ILKVDIAKLVEEKNEGKPIKVVSNLPYYITTPIIMTLLEKRVPVTDMTLMMQEEVARRMQAVPGNKDYGALSLAVQYYSVPYIAAFVPQNCFMPRPNVGSAVVNLKCHKKPSVEVMDEALMFKLIKASFAQRRKTLQNGLTNSAELDFTKEEITEAILKMQEILGMKQNPLIRGETLTLKEFACLSDILSKK
ncbi:MAG: ribosomal RNA small subunit methyltransferase A, partial [Lachnoanaerobaculum gingivalis]